MAKNISISPDNGANWYNYPGMSGSLRTEMNSLRDTIFGSVYDSNQPGLQQWMVQANGYYKGFAGYVADIKKPGATTAFTTEAATLVSGKTYRINDATKRVWDRSVAPTVFDNAVDHTADVETINYLTGEVTFKAAYTVTGPVTITGSFFPLSNVGKASSFNLVMQANEIDTTDFATAQSNGGIRTFIQGLKTVRLEIGGIFDAASALMSYLDTRAELILEINPDGNGKSLARGFFKAADHGQDGEVGALESETINFNLFTPHDDVMPLITSFFGWQHAADTTLSRSIREAIAAWETGNIVDVRYLHDGVNGIKGDCIITECSMRGGVDAMNEFSISHRGTGAKTAVP
jgi:predicted secreted protein